MGIFLIVLGIAIVASVIAFSVAFSFYDHRKMSARMRISTLRAVIWAVVIFTIYGFASLSSIMGSYDTYLDARAYYDNVIAQYKGAITLYEDKAVALDMEKAAKHALTDLRFSGYQNKMGDFIMDLRGTITRYNKCIIKKRIMDKNFFYGWYVIPPDKDMQTIDIISK